MLRLLVPPRGLQGIADVEQELLRRAGQAGGAAGPPGGSGGGAVRGAVRGIVLLAALQRHEGALALYRASLPLLRRADALAELPLPSLAKLVRALGSAQDKLRGGAAAAAGSGSSSTPAPGEEAEDAEGASSQQQGQQQQQEALAAAVDEEFLDDVWAAVAPRLADLSAADAADLAVGLAGCRYSLRTAYQQVGGLQGLGGNRVLRVHHWTWGWRAAGVGG